MKEIFLKSYGRSLVGKGASRSLRREGFVPAVLYGPNINTTNISLKLTEINKMFRLNKVGQFLLDLDINGDIKKVAIKEIQRRPVSEDLLHVDLYEVAMDRKMKVSIPVTTFGSCKGVELGGMLQLVRREVDVLCYPNNIPDSINIDVTNLDIGDSFHAKDLILAEDIEMLGEANYTILTILTQKSETEVVEEVDESDKPIEKI